MKMIINESETKDILENYVRRTLELTPEYDVQVSKKSYEDTFEVQINKPQREE